MNKIFVSIASYRDPECQWTVKDLFEKAAHPERITVGICWQFDPVADKDCFEIQPPFPKQVKMKLYHASESAGGCWARADSLSMLEDEDYVLQIDAHMRFVPGWDEKMIDMLARCPSPKSVLTGHAPEYTPPNNLDDCRHGLPVILVHELGKDDDMQPIHMGWRSLKPDKAPKEPFLTAFIIGNFVFSKADVYKHVPYDPYVYFRGQEPAYSARLWTHCWDLYQPHEVLIYHYWKAQSRDAGGSAQYKTVNAQAIRGKQRVLHLLGVRDATDPDALMHLGQYGMGTARRLDHFWQFAGVDLIHGKIGRKAAKGEWRLHPYTPLGVDYPFGRSYDGKIEVRIGYDRPKT
jgi:glycosyltransferase involved in cell wall biosynthesis